jgi:hypothetical protein
VREHLWWIALLVAAVASVVILLLWPPRSPGLRFQTYTDGRDTVIVWMERPYALSARAESLGWHLVPDTAAYIAPARTLQ